MASTPARVTSSAVPKSDVATTSNVGAIDLPFQRWYRFKEAFSPRFVIDILTSLRLKPATCVDPFGGSGTTALTCQFLGIQPTTIEVNPFLADLIEAKLAQYDTNSLIRARGMLATAVAASASNCDTPRDMNEGPPTLVEPGVNNRWVFDSPVAVRILRYRDAIDDLACPDAQRLFRVLLGSVLVGVSNVVISGKARRYRRVSRRHQATANQVDVAFDEAFQRALFDICRHSTKNRAKYRVIRGDARVEMAGCDAADAVLFSPPYPNSFDYTDIYNIELWMLGYLRTRADNRQLRESTLRSHVQIKRPFGDGPLQSPTLSRTLKRLQDQRAALWNPHIPEMVGAYFEDLLLVLDGARKMLNPTGRIMIVVGDSRYANVVVDVPKIIQELAPTVDLHCESTKAVRAMRVSAQQGGLYALAESLVILQS